MKKIIKIIKREFMTKITSKGFIIATILGPFFLIGISLGPAYFMSLSTDEPLTLVLVDESGEIAPRVPVVFADTLKSGQPKFVFNTVEPAVYREKKESFRADVDAGSIDAVLVIPDTIMHNGTVTYLARSVSDIDLIRDIRNRISDLVISEKMKAAGLDPAKIKELSRKVGIRTIKVVKGEEKQRGFDQEYISSFMFLMILYVTILVYGSAIMRAVVEEKTSRVVEVLLSSARSFELMMGKLLGVGSVGLTQYILWALMGAAAFFIATQSVPAMAQYINASPLVLFYFVVFFIVGFFTFSTLYTAVGAMCSDMQDAQSLSTPVTFLVIIPFIVSFMIIKDPTSDMARMLSFLPFFTPLLMFLRISLVMPPWWEIVAALLINVLTIMGIMWLAARIFRVGILMHGKRPTVPEIIKWLRYS